MPRPVFFKLDTEVINSDICIINLNVCILRPEIQD